MSDTKKKPDEISGHDKPKSLRDSRPPAHELPEVLAKMSPEDLHAGLMALMRLAMERGRAALDANPGLGNKH